MTTLPSPATFYPSLTSDRLQAVSSWLLDELDATEEDLSRSTDNGYTRGCTAFGRQRNRVVAEAMSGKHPWLGIANGDNALVFTIGGVPCRFSNDDPSSPSKDAVLLANRYQMPFLEFAEPETPGRFCFIIDRGPLGAPEAHVEFLGFSPSDYVVCRWVSDAVRVLHVEGDSNQLAAVPVEKPAVSAKRRPEEDDAAKRGPEEDDAAPEVVR